MSKDKKIPVDEFISEKKLNKILDIIKKSDDVEMNYDRIEMLLDDDFEVKDLGTNRIVFVHKKKKYKDYIFKVAGDPHGVEANYREFYNGDLDKFLTFSYSISKNGVFVVQERVTRMTKDMMKEYKKDVRDMLGKLSKKILLVDCKLTNFKNFGVRNNGKVCLLDHGDTVPLPKYQSNEIVNVEEESYVSLRCKRMLEASADKKHLKPCGGKLKYSKNYDSLICNKCGGVSAINDAYREFYGDKRIGSVKGSCLMLEKDFDPDEWKSHIEKYCIETMSHANIKNNNNEEGDLEMKTKTINGQETYQVKGFWLPKPENAMMVQMYNSVRMGQVKPKDYLEALKLNIEDYKVRPADHEINHDDNNLTVDPMTVAANRLINRASETGEFENLITYMEASKECEDFNINFGDMETIKAVRAIMAADNRTAGVIYNENGFSIRVKSACQNRKGSEENETSKPKNVFKERVQDDTDSVVEEDSAVEEIEPTYVEEYASKTESKVVKDLDDEEDEENKKGLVLSSDDIETGFTTFNGVECVVIGKYAVPMSIISQYCNENTGLYELPNKKMKLLIKSHNLSPKKFKLSSAQTDEQPEQEVMQEICGDNMEVKETPDTGRLLHIDDEDTIRLIADAANELAHTSDSKDRIGYCYVSPIDVVGECFLNNDVITEVGKFYDAEQLDDDNLEITVSNDQLNRLYDLFCTIFNKYGTDMLESSPCINHYNNTIGFLHSIYRDDSLADSESYGREKKRFTASSGDTALPFYLFEKVFKLDENDYTFNSLEDYFTELYDMITDDNILDEVKENGYNDTYIREYIKLKQMVFSADNYEDFCEIVSKLGINYILNTVLSYIVFIAKTDEYESCVENLEEYFDDIKDLIESNNIYDIELYTSIEESAEEDESEDEDDEINSDEDNNPNNDEDKEEIDLTSAELIEVLRNLTDVVNRNNDLTEESIRQNYTAFTHLEKVLSKLDTEECDYSEEEACDSPSEETPKLKFTVNDSIVTMDADDISDKMFAIICNGKTVAFDISKLVKEAAADAAEEFINVTKFETNAL